MGNKIITNLKIKKLFRAKEEFHKKLARLPFEEKIAIVVRLQRVSSDIKTSQKKKIWKVTKVT